MWRRVLVEIVRIVVPFVLDQIDQDERIPVKKDPNHGDNAGDKEK